MRTRSRHFISIDIGGTSIRIALLRGTRIMRRQTFKTPTSKGFFIKLLKRTVANFSKGKVISGVGIGTAGIVDSTVLRRSPNIPFIKNFNFRTYIPRHIPLKVDNDARCFARAEISRYSTKRRVFAVTFGTGIGRAYGAGGKIKPLKRFEYPEQWEKEYQKIRDTKNTAPLATFLGKRLSPIIKNYKATVIVCGGGVLRRRKFLPLFARAMRANGIHAKIVRAKFGQRAVLRGAALLFPQ